MHYSHFLSYFVCFVIAFSATCLDLWSVWVHDADCSPDEKCLSCLLLYESMPLPWFQNWTTMCLTHYGYYHLCVCFVLICFVMIIFLLLKATLTVMWHPFFQVLLNQVEFGMNPQQALDQPRICLEDVDRLVLIDSKLLKHLLINCAASVLTLFFFNRAAWVCIKWTFFPSRLAYRAE